MRKTRNLIIGFGKGGKTLAGALAQAGQKTVLIERSPARYGGTCINVACIPTKTLEHSARLSAAMGGSFEERAARYKAAILRKRELTAALRQKNYEKAVSAGVEVVDGEASFTAPRTVSVRLRDGRAEEFQAERVFINTGSIPVLPAIEGLAGNRFVYTSETLMEREELPKKLIIIGGGYIGLEFASYFANFGSEVTIIQDGAAFIPREDSEVAAAVAASFRERGIMILRSAATLSVREETGHAIVTAQTEDGQRKLPADAVLVATGRRPDTAGLNLPAAGIKTTERGAVEVDNHLRASAEGVWAMGDAAGGMQFTYVSLDDSRIVKSQLLGDGSRTTLNRGAIPYCVFIDPPLARVGLSEEDAKRRGLEVKIARLPAGAVPKARVLARPTGLLKAIVDAKNGLVLGAHFFCVDSHEVINLVKLAMDARLPYTALRDAIYTHPTMAEALNDLFATIGG
jgi:pyruvate/2-oxoglutarate dehydrogenase complex dihydrolipoamide dehydrogenase (E3) component